MGKGLFSETFAPMEASSPDVQQHRCPAAMKSSMASARPVGEPVSGGRGDTVESWAREQLCRPAHPRGAFLRSGNGTYQKDCAVRSRHHLTPLPPEQGKHHNLPCSMTLPPAFVKKLSTRAQGSGPQWWKESQKRRSGVGYSSGSPECYMGCY